MNIKNKIKDVISDPKRFVLSIMMHIARIVNSDTMYLKALYRLYTGEQLNLRNPKTFNEKTQWLKAFDHNPLYHTLVDKAKVKEYVSNMVGSQYIIPTLGLWNTFDEIDFSKLPNQFVLKTTNGGGNTGVVICKDKSLFDRDLAKSKLNKSMSYDIYKKMGEWVYKDLKPMIIAETYMEDDTVHRLDDYKFFCFNGEPKILFFASERINETNEPTKFDYYDMQLNHLDIKRRGHKNSEKRLEPFENFSLMKDLATKLSRDIPFVRVDFYNINGHVYFGEMTFYHDSGLVPFEPREWDNTMGEWIKLNSVKL